VDHLSRPFGFIFIIISFIAMIYAIKIDDDLQYMAGLTYAGGALGVTFAGDLFSLYIFWEVMAIASTFLVLARRTEASFNAAVRYVLIHVLGGLSLLAGIVIYVHQTGTTEFAFMELSGLSSWFIFFGIAVNAAIPPLHPWLKDAYPEATVAGAVFLSAFTTKSAVYVMARVFPGADILIALGAMMTCVPIFYAEIENDMRRVLSYSLMNQVGFMMCGIGIGTHLAINGTVSHAFAHILYKALLFMSVGAVLHVTGKIKATDLGGLYKTMPLTTIFCLVGALSISAFPLTSGFVSKSMIISAAGHEKLAIAWLILEFASAGVIAHAGIKVPFFTFFGHDSGIRAKEPPLNMLIAMGIAAFLCIYIGVAPGALYGILPYPVDYVPYTGAHVVGQLQLLMFGVLAFYLMLKAGKYPSEVAAINLDVDWFYRKGTPVFTNAIAKVMNGLNSFCNDLFAVKFTDKLGEWSSSGPARLVMMVVVPARSVLRMNKYDMASVREKVFTVLETGSLPVGISAAAAGMFLIMVFILML
jgi:multicomponent Na+:H+ antiporter subunit D